MPTSYKLTLKIPPKMLPETNIKTIEIPLNITLPIKLHLINAMGIHIMIGRLIPLNTMATAPKIKVA